MCERLEQLDSRPTPNPQRHDDGVRRGVQRTEIRHEPRHLDDVVQLISVEAAACRHDHLVLTTDVQLVREAGGTFTSLDGSPGPHGGSAVATNALLHDQVLARLAAA